MLRPRGSLSGLLLAAVTPWLLAAAPAAAAPKVGSPAPSFSLRDQESTLFKLSDLAYPGKERARQPRKVLVLDFFRTDCKPCRAALPKLAKLAAQFKGQAVQFVLIALLEDDEGEEKLERFFQKNKVPYPVLVDAYAVAAKQYVMEEGKVSIPALFLIDREGVLQAVYRGLDEVGLKELEQAIGKLAQ